jgi:ribonucleotide reductase alpha subunit
MQINLERNLNLDGFLSDLLPKKILNSNGITEEFSLDRIRETLLHEVGVKESDLDPIMEDTVRGIIGLDSIGISTITTQAIRDTVCNVFVKRGLGNFISIYNKIMDKKCMRFRLKDSFLDRFKKINPFPNTLSEFTFKRTYSRRIESENRTEEFWEVLRRCINMCFTRLKRHYMKYRYEWKEKDQNVLAERMYELAFCMKFLPSGRSLWIAGTPHEEQYGSMALNNCAFCSTEDIATKGSLPFRWAMDNSMLGVGIGYDTMGEGKITIRKPIFSNNIFTIPDSREGWVYAVGIVIDGYFYGREIPKFNYSKIRKKGSLIRGFGGKASGYKPLKRLIDDLKTEIFNKRIGKKLTDVDIVDIFTMIARAVVAGNVRRSAQISLGRPDSVDFINLKKDFSKVTEHRSNANNSIIAKVGMDYSPFIESIHLTSEPAFWFKEHSQKYGRMQGHYIPDHPKRKGYADKNVKGTNPCSEMSLESYETCNLVEIVPKNISNLEEFKEVIFFAYLYAKSVTLESTHWEVSNQVMDKNRRIGTSLTGIVDWINKIGVHNAIIWMEEGYEKIKEVDEQISEQLGIPKSKKLTTVKPSGTLSVLINCSSGIHFPHSEWYIRRIRISELNELVDLARSANYHIEDDIYNENTLVIDFPVHIEHFTRGKNDVTIWEQFMLAATLQRHWSDNQVSITITYKDSEKDQVKSCLDYFQYYLKGVSLMRIDDERYKQKPFEKITKDEYDKISKSLKPIDFSKVKIEGLGVSGCTTDVCMLNT